MGKGRRLKRHESGSRHISKREAAEIYFKRRWGQARWDWDIAHGYYAAEWVKRFIVGSEWANSDDEGRQVIEAMKREGYVW